MIPAKCINLLFEYLKIEKEKQTGNKIYGIKVFYDFEVIDPDDWEENFRILCNVEKDKKGFRKV